MQLNRMKERLRVLPLLTASFRAGARGAFGRRGRPPARPQGGSGARPAQTGRKGCPGDGGAGPRPPALARTSDALRRRRQPRWAVDTSMEWEQLVRKVVLLQVPGGRGCTALRKAGTQGPQRSQRTLLRDRGNGGKDPNPRQGSSPGPQRTASPLLSPWPRDDLPRTIPKDASTSAVMRVFFPRPRPRRPASGVSWSDASSSVSKQNMRLLYERSRVIWAHCGGLKAGCPGPSFSHR